MDTLSPDVFLLASSQCGRALATNPALFLWASCPQRGTHRSPRGGFEAQCPLIPELSVLWGSPSQAEQEGLRAHLGQPLFPV